MVAVLSDDCPVFAHPADRAPAGRNIDGHDDFDDWAPVLQSVNRVEDHRARRGGRYAQRRSSLLLPAIGRSLCVGRSLCSGVHQTGLRLRAGVGVVVLLAIAAALALAQPSWAGTGGGTLTAIGAAAPSAGMPTVADVVPAGARLWVVHPGDTLWSIARSVVGNGDERPLVQRLASEVGTQLYPGEVVAIPAGR